MTVPPADAAITRRMVPRSTTERGATAPDETATVETDMLLPPGVEATADPIIDPISDGERSWWEAPEYLCPRRAEDRTGDRPERRRARVCEALACAIDGCRSRSSRRSSS